MDTAYVRDNPRPPKIAQNKVRYLKRLVRDVSFMHPIPVGVENTHTHTHTYLIRIPTILLRCDDLGSLIQPMISGKNGMEMVEIAIFLNHLNHGNDLESSN